MCTLSVITRDDGYHLAMNRDESLTRGAGLPPSRIDLGTATAVFPHDSAGGTWIAMNNHGIALALLNWNDVPRPDEKKTGTRGSMIPALISLTSQDEVEKAWQELDLRSIWPFRLVGVFPAEKRISEWRWNQRQVESEFHEWKARHWFSSSMSDARATTVRGAVCNAAWQLGDARSLRWLRRLHASHVNGPGPFSLCVHREHVGTLSYTEIVCGGTSIECRYHSGSPCTLRELGDPIEMARTAERSTVR